MYNVPVKYKKQIIQELKTFVPLINSLMARGKSSSEEDARILLNDVLHSVLGYNKFNELKTEMRDKNNRFDYGVKLANGTNKSKKGGKRTFLNITLISLVLSLATSCASSSMAPIHLTKIGQTTLYLKPEWNWLLLSNQGLFSQSSATPEDFSKDIQKAKSWEEQAKKTKAINFSKEIESWLAGHVSLTFNYSNQASNITICGEFGSALRLIKCETLPSDQYDEFINTMNQAPRLIKEANDSLKAAKAYN